jgi:hypothetical protein
MGQFLLWSLVGSVVLTVLLNLIPRLFPNAAARAQRRMMDSVESGDQRRVRVIFPWKFMLIASVALTVIVNIVL